MFAEQTDNEENVGKKVRLGRLVGIAGSIILVVLVILVIAKVWLVPGIIRREVKKALSKFCEGPVEIESVEANLFGQVYLGGIRFYDELNRKWLLVEKVKADLAYWPGLRPEIVEIEIDGVDLQILAADGKISPPPVRLSGRSAGPNKKPDLRKLAITKAAITIIDSQGSKAVYDNFALSATKKDGIYEFLLNRASAESSEVFVAGGGVNLENLNVDATLQMNHQFTKEEMNLALTALNMPGVSGEGKVVADLKIDGHLNKLPELQLKGRAKFDGFVLFIKDKVFANNLITTARLDGQRLSFDWFSAIVCKGPVEGSIHVESEKNRPIKLRGQLLAQKMDFAELTSILGEPGKKATKGSVTLGYNFSAEGSGMKSLSGNGEIFFEDADITVFPIFPYIFKSIGLAKIDPLRMADVECKFSTAGPVMKIQSAHIANPYAAIVVEPGGTIDLQTAQIEMYINAVPLRQIESIIKKLPVLDIFFNLKDKLTRFYLSGNWSDPPAKLITKRPIEDIKDGTVGFLQDVVKNGGHISHTMLKGFGVLFKAVDKSDKKKN